MRAHVRQHRFSVYDGLELCAIAGDKVDKEVLEHVLRLSKSKVGPAPTVGKAALLVWAAAKLGLDRGEYPWIDRAWEVVDG